jgi:Na+/proline symporter
MNLELFFGALIVSAGLYGAIAYWKSLSINSVHKFFHITSERDGSLSIVAGNLTLGTGLVYIASLAQEQAIFALVAPIGVVVGYLILCRILSYLSITAEGKNHNILDSIRTGPGGWVFYYFISVVTVITFMVIIPFEIWVSSSLFASMLPAEQGSDMSIIFASVIFIIVIIYSAIGGLRGIVATDVIQLCFIGTMLCIIMAGSFFMSADETVTSSIGLWPKADIMTVVILSLSSFVTAVTTQFYNIINLTVGTSFNSEKQIRLYKKAAKYLFFALVIFVCTGVFTAKFGKSGLAGIDIFLAKLVSIDATIVMVGVFIVVFGMVAALVSSADSGFIAISQVIYENIFRFNSYSNDGGKKLWIVRIFFVVILNSLSSVLLILFFNKKPDIIPLLLTSISALTVSAPFLVSASLNIAKFGKTTINKLSVAIPLVFSISCVWGVSFWRTMENDYQTGNYLILIGVLFGILFFIFDSKISCRNSDIKNRITT